jgi:hypothetical protein
MAQSTALALDIACISAEGAKTESFFVSPLKSQGIVAAQTSTQHESLRGDAT